METSRPWLAYTHRGNAAAATVVTCGDFVLTAVSLSSGTTPFTVLFEVWDVWNQARTDRRQIALDHLYGRTLTPPGATTPASSLTLWPGPLLTWHRHGFVLHVHDAGYLSVKGCIGVVGDVSLCLFDETVILCGQRYLEPVRIEGELASPRKQRTKLPQQAGNVVQIDVRACLYVCTDKGHVLAYNFSGKALTLVRTFPIADPTQKKPLYKYMATSISFPYVAGKEVDAKGFSDSFFHRTEQDPRGFLYLFESTDNSSSEIQKSRMLHTPAPVHAIAVYRDFVLLAMSLELAIVHNNHIITSVKAPFIKNGFVLARNFAVVVPDLWMDIDALVCSCGFNLCQVARLITPRDTRQSVRPNNANSDMICFITEDMLVSDSKHEHRVLLEDVVRILDVDSPRFLLGRKDSAVLWNAETNERNQLPFAVMGYILRTEIITISKGTKGNQQVLNVYNERNKYLATKELDVDVLALIRDKGTNDTLLAATRTHLIRMRWSDSGETRAITSNLWKYPAEGCVVSHVWNDQTLVIGFPRMIYSLQENAQPNCFVVISTFSVVRCYTLAVGLGKVFVSTPTAILEVPVNAHATAPPFSMEKPMGILAVKSDRMILVEESRSRNDDEGTWCTKRRIRYRPMTPSAADCTDSRTAWPDAQLPWKQYACLHAPPQLRDWAKPALEENDTFRAVALRTLGLSVGERRRLSITQLTQTRNALEENVRRLVLEDRRDDIRALVAYTVKSSTQEDVKEDNPNALKLVSKVLSGFLLIQEFCELFEWVVQPPCTQLLDAFAQSFYYDDEPLPNDALRLSVLDHWHGIAVHRSSVNSIEDPRMGMVSLHQRAFSVTDGVSAPYRMCTKDNLVIYWRCADRHGDVVGDSAGLGRHGDIEDGQFGEELNIVEAEDDWGVKKRPNHAVILPRVNSCIVYPGDDCTEMDEWTIEFHMQSEDEGNYLVRIGDVWIRRDGGTMVGPFGPFETVGGNGINVGEWTYIAIRYKDRNVDICTGEGVRYTAQAARFTIPGSVPLQFGGQCKLTEIRVWNVWRDWNTLLDFYQRPLPQISDSQNRAVNWKNIRFLEPGARKRSSQTSDIILLPIAPPPGERSPQKSVCTGVSIGVDDSPIRADMVTTFDIPEVEITSAGSSVSPLPIPSRHSPTRSPIPSFMNEVIQLSPTRHLALSPDALSPIVSPTSLSPIVLPEDATRSDPSALYGMHNAKASPPRVPPCRARRKINKNPFMPQIKEEEEPALRGKGFDTARDATAKVEEPAHPITHEAFSEMICGRFDRAELLLGALNIRGRWVYQACLKLLRTEHECAHIVEKAQIACMLLRLPVLSAHRTTLRKRAMGWFAMAGAVQCALHVSQVLMIESNGEEEIMNAYRALKAKAGPVPNLAVCGICPNCDQHMPLHPFETKCRVCGCDTAFDSKQMKLINKKNSQKCRRCGFVELRPKSNECGFCGTVGESQPIVSWY